MKLLYTIIFLNTSLIAMKPVDERVPLLAPQKLVMDELPEIANAPNILCTGSRRFFDQGTKRKVACEKCCKNACAAEAVATCAIGAIVAGQIPLYKWFCCGKTSGCLLPGCCGMAAEFMVPGCMIMYALTLYVSIRDKTYDNPQLLEWIEELKVPLELLKVASPTKEILLAQEDLVALLYRVTHKPILNSEEYHEKEKSPDYYICCPSLSDCIRFFTRFNSTRTSIIDRIKKRLNKKPLIPYQIAQFLRTKKLPKEIIKIILKYADLPALYHVTEKELLYILHGLSNRPNQPYQLPNVCKIYAQQILMAKSGWFSFSQSQHYPIPISMKYFDLTQIPYSAARWHIAFEGPQLYFPYSSKLALYYRFENDPFYKEASIQESNEQIKHLLELREKHLKQSN